MTFKKITQTILCLTLILCFSIVSSAQIGYETRDDDEDDIFDTDVEGATPRWDERCYDRYATNGIHDPLRFNLVISAGNPIDLYSLPCTIGLNITIGGITVNEPLDKFDLNGEQQYGVQDIIFGENVSDLFSDCEDGIQTLPIIIEFTCTVNQVTTILTVGQVNQSLGINFNGLHGGSNSPFSQGVQIPFCCEASLPELGNGIIENSLIENRSITSLGEIKIINNSTNFEVYLDSSFGDKDIAVGLFDMSGRHLSEVSYRTQKSPKSILVNKPVNQLGMYLLSIRTDDQIITQKVVNY